MSELDAGKTGFGGAPVALVPPSQDAGAAGTAGDALASASKHDEPAVVFVLFFFLVALPREVVPGGARPAF